MGLGQAHKALVRERALIQHRRPVVTFKSRAVVLDLQSQRQGVGQRVRQPKCRLHRPLATCLCIQNLIAQPALLAYRDVGMCHERFAQQCSAADAEIRCTALFEEQRTLDAHFSLALVCTDTRARSLELVEPRSIANDPSSGADRNFGARASVAPPLLHSSEPLTIAVPWRI
jgi:hypothetical protein